MSEVVLKQDIKRAPSLERVGSFIYRFGIGPESGLVQCLFSQIFGFIYVQALLQYQMVDDGGAAIVLGPGLAFVIQAQGSEGIGGVHTPID